MRCVFLVFDDRPLLGRRFLYLILTPNIFYQDDLHDKIVFGRQITEQEFAEKYRYLAFMFGDSLCRSASIIDLVRVKS